MRKEIFAPDEYYHIYSRGVDKRVVFLDDHDRFRFINTLYILNNFLEIPHHFDIRTLTPRELLEPRKPFVNIAAGCLMDTHYHLVMDPLAENGISALMHKVGVSYSMYFNKRHERTGRLFESTFKAKHIDRPEYAEYITHYIHLNPAVLFNDGSPQSRLGGIEQYQWSSLPDYLGEKSGFSLLLSSSFRNDVLGVTAGEYRKLLHDLYRD